MITVGEAKQIAQEWVEAEVPNIPNFQGAFLIGSILWKDDDDPFPPASDVDVRIVVDIDPPTLMSMKELGQKHYMFHSSQPIGICYFLQEYLQFQYYIH